MWEQKHSVHSLLFKGHSLGGWIFRGTLLCEHYDFFFLQTKGLFMFLITQDCLPTESTHTMNYSFHILSSSHFFLLCHALQSCFPGLLFCWPKLAKDIILIKLVGHRSEQLIKKRIFYWLVITWKKVMLFCSNAVCIALQGFNLKLNIAPLRKFNQFSNIHTKTTLLETTNQQ